MNGQRGSVLAGVMGLSIILTLAGMGYLMVLSHAQSQGENLERDMRLRNAAESALIVGTRYAMEGWRPSYYNSTSATINLISPGWIEMDGARINLYLDRRTTPIRIICQATLLEGSDTLELTWSVDSAVAATSSTYPKKPATDSLTRLVLKDWTETIIPYRRSP